MKYIAICICLLSLHVAAALCAQPARAAGSGKVYGLFERVILPDIGPGAVEAKLDTGAETSSLGARDIIIFEKEGQDRVRFTPQLQGAPEMELPLFRTSRIKRRADDTGDTSSLRRPVVLLNICFDGKTYQIEVNLTDRSRFEYPLLIGSRALVHMGAAVDPSLSGTASVSCP